MSLCVCVVGAAGRSTFLGNASAPSPLLTGQLAAMLSKMTVDGVGGFRVLHADMNLFRRPESTGKKVY